MEFVLWSCRVVHILSAVVWIGGLVYSNAILGPVLEHERLSRERWLQIVHQRTMGYVWTTLWPLLITGGILMTLNPGFRWGEWGDGFNRLLAVKQMSFLLMAFFSWQTTQVLKSMQAEGLAAEEFEGWRLAFVKLIRRTIVFGIIAVCAAEGMRWM